MYIVDVAGNDCETLNEKVTSMVYEHSKEIKELKKLLVELKGKLPR